MSRSKPILRLSLAAMLLGLLVSSWARAATPLAGSGWRQDAGFRTRPVSPAGGGGRLLVWMSNALPSVAFTNTLPLARARVNNNLMNGAGVAAGDFDGDGLVDLYFCNLGGANALFRNLGGWRFEEVAAAAGAACTNQASTGAVFADVNGDGWLDLLVTSCGGPNACLVNDGRGHFTDVTREAGLLSRAGSTSMALADIDGDGDLDLYVANYAALSILRSGGQITVRTVNGQPVVTGPYAERIRIVDGRMVELGEPDVLYLNDGRGRFTPVSWTGGQFLDEDGKPLREPPQDLGLSVMFRDLNGDGAPDLYVCNDYDGPDRIWINDGHGRFRALPRLALRCTSQFSMSVDVADVNRDGFDDIFVADMLSRFHPLRMTQMGILGSPPRPIGLIEDRPQIRRNTLHLARGDGTYADVANIAGVDASDWTWCGVFLDVDLDGFEDLLIANGHAFDIQDIDASEEIRRRGRPASVDEARDALVLYPRLETPNCAFHNLGGRGFEEVGKAWGFDSTRVSHGIALADLDNDGDLDVVVSCLNAPPLLYRNESTAARVAVRLKGAAGNTRGVGSRIRVGGGPVTQTQEIHSGGRYLSGDDAMRTFAAGSSMTLEVAWRSGRRSVVTNVLPNRVYEVEEPVGDAVTSSAAPVPSKPPLFTDVSSRIAHVHHEEPFDDFVRQPLLPRRLSQLGPGVTWFDIDGDGNDDLILPSGKGGGLAGYRSDGHGGFTRLADAPFDRTASADQTAALGWESSTGVRSLLVGRAIYEEVSSRGPSALQYSSTNGFQSDSARIPGSPSSTGPLALADVDGDGDLDLFVGGRVLPGRYPEAAGSRLFRNEGGRWVLDATASALLGRVGLVSGAVFSDLNLDGFPELILACEWGPVRVFENSHGTFREITAVLGLEGQTGWWNAVTTGDLDGDGRQDLIVSNWGLNSEYHATPAQPATILFGNLRGGGAVELIESEPDPATGQLAPRRDLVHLGAVLPQFRARYPTHKAFSTATLGEIAGLFDPAPSRLEARELRSMVFLNRGDHMEPHPMPAEAQWAPAFGACVADFDGDGFEDVLLAQNFFATAPDLPRLDAGRGLLLRGDGRGGLTPVGGGESGVRVYGEQRGAAVCDFDGDGRADVALSQNGAETVLLRNVGAMPGLRVRLRGRGENPGAVGAQLRLVTDAGPGAGRELHLGAGYWSQDSLVAILATPRVPRALQVRWPGGETVEVALAQDAREVEVSYPGSIRVVARQGQPR